jgi:DNA-binding LytR/AlgR family response regulator
MTKIHYPLSDNILFLKGDINYTEFHLENGKIIVSSYTLLKHHKSFTQFIRISKKYLINPKFIKKLNTSGRSLYIELMNGAQIIVSRRNSNAVKNIYARLGYNY